MATTVNNTTINTKLTIIFDSGPNEINENDGPRLGTGNTESDVIIDSKSYLNIRSHTEIEANVHALQWNATTNTGELEYIDNRQNESLSSFPQWATNVVIRCEAQDVWQTEFTNNISAQRMSWTNAGNAEEDFRWDEDQANTHADAQRITYLSANNITY
jgi:hypothetical protein